VIHADEGAAFDELHALYIMAPINHEEAYSKDGACTNQAESFFSRMRRSEVGIHHHIASLLPPALCGGNELARGHAGDRQQPADQRGRGSDHGPRAFGGLAGLLATLAVRGLITSQPPSIGRSSRPRRRPAPQCRAAIAGG
jgi:hypothetical protein